MLTLKIKRLSEDAILPVQSTPGAGCWDVFASSDPDFVMREGECQYVEYETGLSFELPDGYDMLIFPRSSISSHTDLILCNGPGFLDHDFRGMLRFRFRLLRKDNPMLYRKGDRIGQIKLIAKTDMEILEVDELSETQRGEGGFGSTGK